LVFGKELFFFKWNTIGTGTGMDYFACGTVEFKSQDFVRNEEKYILFLDWLLG